VNGAEPGAQLSINGGYLYGTTEHGGINCKKFDGCGTIFRLSIP
jgi:uncharacterized repeat protein (TIGR03803 family)